jgi:epoxyqueuosine reductase
MDYMARHGDKRSRPAELLPGTLRVISVRMDYGTGEDAAAWDTLADGERAYVARYALGRDYHKLMRARLQKLADRIAAEVGGFGYRVFVDSAPVLERALARNAGLGWIGKNACLIDKTPAAGSSSASSTPTCRCRWTRRRPRTAAPARAASRSARRRRSSRRTASTRAAASAT